MHHSTKLTTLVAAMLMLVGLAGPAAAARPPQIDLRGATVGAYHLDDAGVAQLGGAVTGKPFDGPYTATLAADDGSLPEPGDCEPATATLRVTGPRGRFLALAATGEVCGRWTDATSVVTHRFTGRYLVVDTSERKLRGGDGWMGLTLATEGRANVEAFDS
jgi:hypothetical protein